MQTMAEPRRLRAVLLEVAVVAGIERLGRDVARRHRTKRSSKPVQDGATRHRDAAVALLAAVVTGLIEIAVSDLASQRYRMRAAIDRAAANQYVSTHVPR